MRLARLIGVIGSMAAVLSVGCGDSTSPNPIVGTWNLSTLNGLPLPYVQSSTVVLNSDGIAISGDGTFVRRYSRRTGGPSSPSDESLVESGTYTVAGSAVTFTRTSELTRVRSGTFDGQTITLTGDGLYAYTRQ